MRKLNELNSEEFFDVICAISPVLHIILNMKLVQGFLFKNYDEKLTKIRNEQHQCAILYEKEKDTNKKTKLGEKLKELVNQGNQEIALIMSNDIMTVLPKLAGKEHRQSIYEIFAIIDKKNIEDIKLYPATELSKNIQKLISDTDFKSFLSYAEKSEQTELLSTPQNLQDL